MFRDKFQDKSTREGDILEAAGKGGEWCGSGGWTRDRTGDTRIFSPLLYRLSYPAIFAEVK
jgi:hypothetical protein